MFILFGCNYFCIIYFLFIIVAVGTTELNAFIFDEVNINYFVSVRFQVSLLTLTMTSKIFSSFLLIQVL